jgi:protein-S-isoprenylcysteine O-methyltransferase Ste14
MERSPRPRNALGSGRYLSTPIPTGSILAIGAAGLLFVMLAAKFHREEAWLAAIHPEYGAYKRRTNRLIPWIY